MLDFATETFRRSAALAATAALMAFAAPAAAETPTSQAGVTAAAASTTVSHLAKAKKASGERKYCVKMNMTESRIAKKICKTKNEWAADGTDIDDLTK
jgi:mannosyltransferase OCH1-like enzyme